MRAEKLFDAITLVDDELIDAAGDYKPKKRSAFRPWMGIAAACLALFVGVSAGVVTGRLPWLRIGDANTGAGAGGSGVNPPEEGPSTFMSYAGPVFPLTLKEENDTITAERNVTLDFAPWIRTWWSNEDEANSRDWLTEEERQEVLDTYNEVYPEGGHWQSSSDILVTDSYTLTNTSDQDQTLTVLYPFAGNLSFLEDIRPALTVDGEALETTLYAGAYTGGYMGVWGGDMVTPVEEGSVNLDSPDSWEDYRDALADGTYLQNALGDYPDFRGTKVIVYEFTDPWSEPRDDKAGIPNPTIRAWFSLDYSKTAVLSTGFHGGSYDRENGRMGLQFSIPQPGERDYGQDNYRLIVVGDDIRDLTTQGYVTGGWDTKKTIEAGVTITRREADLEDVLRQAAREMFAYQADYDDSNEGIDFEMFFGLFKVWLVSDGPLSGSGVQRYDNGWLENNDVRSQARVFYLEAEVTVPAGGSVELTASMRKEASYDFYCAHTENQGVDGYDLVTRLGSNLNCTAQTATLEDRGQIQIVRQNFGFDLENGVKRVPLTGEEYFLEVKRAPEETEP